MKLVLLGVDRILLVGCCCLLLPGAAASPARERISRYVEEGQMFMIQDAAEIAILLEKPNNPMTPGGNVKWLCTPNHTPDTNGDGVHDSVVGHMLLYRPPKEVEDLQQQGGEVKGSWSVGGFTSAWANDHYNEYMVMYSNPRIAQLTEIMMDDDDTEEDADNTTNAAASSSWFSSVVYMEPSTPAETSGLTAATEVEWTFNATSNPKLVEMAEELGKELTGTTCEEKYAEVWTALKSTTSSSSSSTSSSTLAIMIITTVSSLYSLW